VKSIAKEHYMNKPGLIDRSIGGDEFLSHSLPKILTVILIQVAIALIHVFRLGQMFQGRAYDLYYSYFSDFILPFGAYFLITMNEVAFPFLRKWYVKAGLVFAFTTFAEICQFFGVEVLGATFDPFDILVYGMGVLFAAFIDQKVFARYLSFWAVPKSGEKDQAKFRRA